MDIEDLKWISLLFIFRHSITDGAELIHPFSASFQEAYKQANYQNGLSFFFLNQCSLVIHLHWNLFIKWLLPKYIYQKKLVEASRTLGASFFWSILDSRIIIIGIQDLINLQLFRRVAEKSHIRVHWEMMSSVLLRIALTQTLCNSHVITPQVTLP